MAADPILSGIFVALLVGRRGACALRASPATSLLEGTPEGFSSADHKPPT